MLRHEVKAYDKDDLCLSGFVKRKPEQLCNWAGDYNASLNSNPDPNVVDGVYEVH